MAIGRGCSRCLWSLPRARLMSASVASARVVVRILGWSSAAFGLSLFFFGTAWVQGPHRGGGEAPDRVHGRLQTVSDPRQRAEFALSARVKTRREERSLYDYDLCHHIDSEDSGVIATLLRV